MGLFDEVQLRCPRCGTDTRHQTKGADPAMRLYTVPDAPSDVMADLIGHPLPCDGCGAVWTFRAEYTLMAYGDHPTEEPDA